MPAAFVKEAIMEVIHESVAGLDVHKDSVVACVRIMSGGKPKRECRTPKHRAGVLESDCSDRDEDDSASRASSTIDRLDAGAEFGGEFA